MMNRRSFSIFPQSNVLQANVGVNDALAVDRYVCVEPQDFSQLDRTIQLTGGHNEDCSFGTILKRRGTTDILDWRKSSDSIKPGVTLRINSLAVAQFEWAFDRQSRRAVGLSPVQGLESNLTTLLSLLAVCGNSRTIELAQPLLQHERHFLRWAAAKTIAALDSEAGWVAVQSLLDDPHPEVREVARRVSAAPMANLQEMAG